MTNYEGFLKSGIIEDEIMKREWTLSDVLDMDNTVDEIVQGLIVDMDLETKYNIVGNVQINSAHHEMSISELITHTCRIELNDMVSFVVSNYLKTAKVEFNDNNNTNRNNKEPMVGDNLLVQQPEEKVLESNSQVEKIMTLKERIRQDTKQLEDEDKKGLGMI